MLNKIKNYYGNHFLGVHTFLITIFTSIIFFVFWKISYLQKISDFITNQKDLFNLVASISASLLGFVITGLSILIVFYDSSKLEIIKKSKHKNLIYTIYFSTIKYLAVLTIVSILLCFLSGKQPYNLIFLFIFCWSFALSVFRIHRCLWILSTIIKIITKN